MALKSALAILCLSLSVFVIQAQTKPVDYNDPRQIKALIERIVIKNQKTEGDTVAINELGTAIDRSAQPARAILQNLLAGAYWSYFQQNRWKLYNRTNTINFIKNDLTTWTIDDFHRKISALYLSSLQDERLLTQTTLDRYEPIILKGNVRNLRPTLFDLLAHEALDYFKNDETDIQRPADVFEIDDPAVFGDAAGFTAHRFITADTASLHYKALLLLQRLIRFHLPDKNPDALLDVDIERLQFANANAVMDNKVELYRQALVRITFVNGERAAAAEAWYLQAELYNRLGDEAETSGDTTHNRDKAKAADACKKVLAQPDSSAGKTSCRILLNDILQQQLNLQVERVNLPGQPMRAFVSWKNFTQLNLRLIRLDNSNENLTVLNTWTEPFWDKLLVQPVFRSLTQTLPATGDYRTHSTEMAIGSLPPGVYALAACTDAGWSRKNGIMTVQYFYVSSIAYINNDNHFFVLNRESGQPLNGASVQVYEGVYNERAQHLEFKKAESYKTDQHGQFLLAKPTGNDRTSRYLEIRMGDDRLFLTDQGIPYYLYNLPRDENPDKEDFEKKNIHTLLFLDRAIYRPGQTVYFKGIVLTRDYDSLHPRILTGHPAKLSLYNANGEAVDSLTLTTNEFGSYHGMFRLPEHQLNGRFRITDESTHSSHSFSVEEYKRPGFYITYDQPKDSYRLGDSIRIMGNARAYAGNDLDGAKVKYTIRRQTRYPHPWLFWRSNMPGSISQEIVHGESVTDGRGGFRFVFPALPDKAVPRSSDPQFEYKITTDVTDINGETHTGTTTILVGYTALNLSIDIPDGLHLPAGDLNSFNIHTSNLAGEPVSSLVHVAAYPLQAPDRLIRERMWDAPDMFVMSEAAFRDSFPHDPYREEEKKESWPRGMAAWEAINLTRGPDTARQPGDKGLPTFQIPSGRLSPGWWVIEASTTDRYGQVVKALHYVELYDASGRPATPEYNWAQDSRLVLEPGETAHLSTGSSAGNVYVIRKGRDFSYFNIDKGKKDSIWMVQEADRGGFGISDVFIKDNRMYEHRTIVQVPWSNKELQIHYTTYRDKTLPGSGEKWAVNISGNKGGRVSAEVLAAMYDASLDQFASQRWSMGNLYPEFDGGGWWQNSGNFQAVPSFEHLAEREYPEYYSKTYDQLLSPSKIEQFPDRSGRIMVNGKAFPLAQNMAKFDANQQVVIGYGTPRISKDTVEYKANGFLIAGIGAAPAGAAPQQILVRKNFNETAFFFPDLRTDTAGNISFSFTMPEALTRWKWMTLAHTRDMAFAFSEKSVITQKQLMVQPNVPRFLREGDRMDFSVKIVNLTDSEMTGQIGLQLTDPTTGETADGWFVNRQPNQYFTVGARSSVVADFPLDIPFQYNRPLTYRIIAQSGNYSDGEEATLPVVSNRMLVTETLPLNMPGDGTRQFQFTKLLKSGASETLSHHALTVEFTANPAWYAIQALPYLMEYPYECAEQTFNRFYANALAARIVNSTPRLREVFTAWRTTDTAALLSNLQKNQELKSVLLEETPWVLQGKTEQQQRQNIALLFDLDRMGRELDATLDKLRDMQTAAGGFVWFKGGRDDRYITQYILTGIGRLQQLQAIPPLLGAKIKTMVAAALPYLDDQIKQDYELDKLHSAPGGAKPAPTPLIGVLPVQYLYMRSFFNDYGIPGSSFAAVNYYRKKAQQTWVQYSRYMQGMIALALFRTGDIQTGRNIVAYLRQSAIRDEEKGMYWKGMDDGGYFWYQAPVEIESLLIEAFREIGGNSADVRDMKTWLLRQKQTHNWPTTKATADACYALLMGGQDWLNAERVISIKLGDKSATSSTSEAGTGYFKKIFDAPFINPSMGNITVTMHTQTPGSGSSSPTPSIPSSPSTPPTSSPAWGAVYWQYFDQLDHITPSGSNKAGSAVAKTPLSLTKKLFVQRNTDRGPVLDPLQDNATLKVGDRVVVRIELRADRSLEYVHMKDMRAACMEPVNVISAYKWQGGLGYYETTKDASTDFFFSSIGRGTYVFEYTLLAGQTGNFSNGVTSIECMYAPEFAFHSEGIRVNVEAAP